MLIRGAKVLNDQFRFVSESLRIENTVIAETGDLTPAPGEECIDAEGLFLIPGLIDVHMHGYSGISCATTSSGERYHMGKMLAREGVTGYAATLASMSDEKAFAAIPAIVRDARSHKPENGASIHAIHMEGPFLNPVKKGAMDENRLRTPSAELLQQYTDLGEGMVRIMTIAPELMGAASVIQLGSENGIRMSMGHTNATRQEVLEGLKAGITRVTHTFNAMRPLDHRESGILGEALTNDRIQCELIGDFVHVKPEVCLMLIRLKGADRVTLISDSCELAGLTNDMIPKGLPYVIRDAAYLSNGTLCGSTCTVRRCVKNVMSLGFSMEEAVKMASLNPARDLGVDGMYGSILPGKRANLVLVDGEMNVLSVFIEGKRFA